MNARLGLSMLLALAVFIAFDTNPVSADVDNEASIEMPVDFAQAPADFVSIHDSTDRPTFSQPGVLEDVVSVGVPSAEAHVNNYTQRLKPRAGRVLINYEFVRSGVGVIGAN